MIGMKDEVKDEISKFKGIVVGYAEYLNGCERYLVQALIIKDGKISDPEWIDVQQLKVTKKSRKKGVSLEVTLVKMGDRVKDNISKFQGIATGRIIFLNGCVRIMVRAEKVKDEKILEPEWIDETQLDVTKTAERKSVPNEPPGGPTAKPEMGMSGPKS